MSSTTGYRGWLGKSLLLVLSACAVMTSSCRGGSASSSNQECASRDTVLRFTLEGERCMFANKAEYGVFVPGTGEPLQAVFVLQHGCTMEQFGITRAYDLQYHAFARKWNIAVIETALYGECRIWGKPESGSADALFDIMSLAGEKTGHPELADAPMLLFGHSGGGFWTLEMLRAYPEKIIALVGYSAAFDPQWDYPSEAADVPVLLRHAGSGDLAQCVETAEHHFAKLRALDAPASIALNEGENHNYSQMRTISIPFYEAAMRQRLPKGKSKALRGLNPKKTWLGDPATREIFKESGYEGDKASLCRFVDEASAKDWQEYVTSNIVADKTAPKAPYALAVERTDSALVATWKAEADVESGILRFDVYADGKLAGSVPEQGGYQNFDLNGDNAYPVVPAPMQFIIKDLSVSKVEVELVNRSELKSTRTVCTNF